MSTCLSFTRNLLRPINIISSHHIRRRLLSHDTPRMTSTTAKTPTAPRLSASLLLINPRNEILLVHRPTHSSTFPNAHVFPGGATSPEDSTSPAPLKLCAIRETFEETGLLLTHPPPPPSVISTIPEARSQIHAGKLSFTAYLQSHNLAPALHDLIPFTSWITPKSMPRRFEAHMFLSFLPDTSSSSSGTQQQLPTSDGGIEILSTRFLTPQAALDAARRDELVFFPPQFYLLSMLAPYLQADAGIEDHSAGVRRRRLVRFAQEGFGDLVMEPAPLKRLGDGRVVMGLGERGDGERVVVIQLAGKGEPRGLEIVGRGEVAKL